MSYDYLKEAERLKQVFSNYVTEHKGNVIRGTIEEQLNDIILDIKMLLYSYDPEMPLTLHSRNFPDARMCVFPEIYGYTERQTSQVIISTLDKFIAHLHRKASD